MQHWLGGFNQGVGRPFSEQLRAFPILFFEAADSDKVTDMDYSGKILLPASSLDKLLRLNIQYPMLFKLSNCEDGVQRFTHCGVLEFSAQEGRCYLPGWMMRQLLLTEGAMVRIDSATLVNASYCKLKPLSVDFLNISNPRAVLEVELRKFACLTKNDRIAVRYADQVLEFQIRELKPQNAVCIIECDLNLDFDAPEGYVEPKVDTYVPKPAAPLPTTVASPPTQFSAFSGSGMRLDGKKKPSSSSLSEGGNAGTAAVQEESVVLGPVVCNPDYKPGKLNFVRYDYKSRAVTQREMKDREENSANPKVTPFQGGGKAIRKRY